MKKTLCLPLQTLNECILLQVAGKDVDRRVVAMETSNEDDTLPVSASDEHSWMVNLRHLGAMSTVDKEEIETILNAAHVYYNACKEQVTLVFGLLFSDCRVFF